MKKVLITLFSLLFISYSHAQSKELILMNSILPSAKEGDIIHLIDKNKTTCRYIGTLHQNNEKFNIGVEQKLCSGIIEKVNFTLYLTVPPALKGGGVRPPKPYGYQIGYNFKIQE